ncbi:glycosyltransferase [Kutzneria kofuensis]|uniref:glycosyltransferase n=1 Tax=Kutzneria kofuensis TaxID=103725 RepID=UPI00337EC07B
MKLGDPTTLEWHFFVPCRDEQAVIGATVTYLRQTFRAAHVWVVDDDSDDRTATVVRNLRRIDGRNIHLVQRYRPQARTGKGDALNAGYRALKAWQGRHATPERAIVIVLDAGGRPMWNCLGVTAAHFEERWTGSVQIDVRTSNAGRGWFEWLTNARRIDTSRLSGNGQFIRLSALDSIAGPEGEPWRGERLSAAWQASHTRDTYVYQRALPVPQANDRTVRVRRVIAPVPAFDH